MLDLKTNQWEQLNYKGCPSPRSGHRMVSIRTSIFFFFFLLSPPHNYHIISSAKNIVNILLLL